MPPCVTAIVLNWNELHLVKLTVELLLREPDVEVVVVDNGSRDGSAEWLAHTSKRADYQGLRWALLDKNHGSSVARNVGIEMAKGLDIFLIDGDILYVPGTIRAYQEVLRSDPYYGCVGYNDYARVQQTGMNGTAVQAQAEVSMPAKFNLSKWFPMAWTQYGLFRGDVLRKVKVVSEGCFGEFGHGYEDDWLFHALEEEGYLSIAADAPLYYHDGHYSLRLLQQMNLPDRGPERAEAFYKKWGHGNGWRERMAKIRPEQKVPFAVHPA